MKLFIISDPHLDALSSYLKDKLKDLKLRIDSVQADALVVLGDIDSGIHPNPEGSNALLSLHPYTVFVEGNHDLWNVQDLTPPEALARALKRTSSGKPLETAWDNGCVVHHKGITFVGSMGFPDFKHPRLVKKMTWYDIRCSTNDARFMDIRNGWRKHTVVMEKAFLKRLKEAFASATGDLIVATHYPILDAQSTLREGDEPMWAYFFNWTMGQQVLKLAEKYPKVRVLCLAGHSHEFCTGELAQVTKNVWAYGAQGQYGRIPMWLFDTDLWKFVPKQG